MDNLAQVGIGGAIVLLALAQMFAFLKSRKANGSMRCPLEQTMKFWEQNIAAGVVRGLNESLRPVIENQTRILEKLGDEQAATRRDLSIIEAQTRK